MDFLVEVTCASGERRGGASTEEMTGPGPMKEAQRLEHLRV